MPHESRTRLNKALSKEQVPSVHQVKLNFLRPFYYHIERYLIPVSQSYWPIIITIIITCFSTSQQDITIISNDIINYINATWTQMSSIKWMDGLTNQNDTMSFLYFPIIIHYFPICNIPILLPEFYKKESPACTIHCRTNPAFSL